MLLFDVPTVPSAIMDKALWFIRQKTEKYLFVEEDDNVYTFYMLSSKCTRWREYAILVQS